jgi:hypothetical protein
VEVVVVAADARCSLLQPGIVAHGSSCPAYSGQSPGREGSDAPRSIRDEIHRSELVKKSEAPFDELRTSGKKLN